MIIARPFPAPIKAEPCGRLPKEKDVSVKEPTRGNEKNKRRQELTGRSHNR
jgi:hypothetical protein